MKRGTRIARGVAASVKASTLLIDIAPPEFAGGIDPKAAITPAAPK